MNYVVSPDPEFADGPEFRDLEFGDTSQILRNLGSVPLVLGSVPLVSGIRGHDPSSPEFGIVSPRLEFGAICEFSSRGNGEIYE
jgi:hypothetical protein